MPDAAPLKRAFTLVIEYLDLLMVERPTRELADTSNTLVDEFRTLEELEQKDA